MTLLSTNRETDRLFERIGTVRAMLLTEDRHWRTRRGDIMLAHAGDWMVSNNRGDSWSVIPAVFALTYRHIAGATYDRTGLVRARRVVVEETVHTLEGDAIAQPGDWVVTGVHGESWPVTPEDFTVHYRSFD